SKFNIQGYVVFTLSDPSLTIQNFSLPKMPYDEVSEAVKWEISRSLKLDPADTLFDFIICKNPPDSDKEGIYVVTGVCSREPYERIARVLHKAKLRTLGCDIPILCDFRLLDRMGYFDPDKTYILMNFGALFTNLSIIYKKEIVFNRRISLNGHLLTKAVKDYCKIEPAKAEEYKTHYGLSADVLSDNIIESVNIINSNCEKMLSDIQYSLKYFSYQVTRSNITTFDKVYMTGGASQLKGFKDFVKDRLNIEITPLSFEGRLSVSKKLVPEPDAPESVSAYVTTAAGGLLWTRRGINWDSANLLPGELTEGGKKEFISYKTVAKRLFSVFGAFLVLFAFFIALFLIHRYQLNNLSSLRKLVVKEEERKEQVERNNRDLLNIKAQKVKENEDLEAQILIMKRKLEDLKNYQLSEVNPAHFVAEVINLVPHPDVVLNIISFEGDKLVLRGDAVNNTIVSQYMKSLNNSRFFYNTNFEFMEKTAEGKTAYPISFKLTTKIYNGKPL
ncbi:MAG: pilus assembly protein PilM, partial [Candidatus Aureabacteria bacterium]|nr:pilus assembly protein PilM [Candidatus Auribacterota bacterium]